MKLAGVVETDLTNTAEKRKRSPRQREPQKSEESRRIGLPSRPNEQRELKREKGRADRSETCEDSRRSLDDGYAVGKKERKGNEVY